jgi:predicted alternative tryptophan synthase beta-subunit
MSEPSNISREAGEQFHFAISLSFQDAMQRKLRYHLLRLTAVGIRREEVEDLTELGRLAFQGSDVNGQVAKIKQEADGSSLAFAIADILEKAGTRGSVNLRAVMLGAVLGAYTATRSLQGVDEKAMAILGAVGGAVATSTSSFIFEHIGEPQMPEYFGDED